MKKITAANDNDNSRTGKRGLDEMRSIPVDGGAKAGLGRGFKKVGVDTSAGGGGGFKKVGVAVEGAPSGFKRVGVTTSISAAPSGFKKVGVVAQSGGSSSVNVTKTSGESVPFPPGEPVPGKIDTAPSRDDSKNLTPVATVEKGDLGEAQKSVEGNEKGIEGGEDVTMAEGNEEELPWGERRYDFRRPTGCNHETCPGCKPRTIAGLS